MDHSPPGFSVHEISLARILEWIAIAYSRGSSQPRDRIQVSCKYLYSFRVMASLVAQMVKMVKNLPAMQETWLQSLGREYPPEKGMAMHSSILAWRIPWTEKPGGLQSMVSQESQK